MLIAFVLNLRDGPKSPQMEENLSELQGTRSEGKMDDQDLILAQRIRDIIAVATPDIDAIMVEVEDGVAYVEGVVPCESHRRAILRAIRELPQLTRLISCLP